MSQYIIAKRYAKALYNLALETNVLDDVYNDIKQLNGLMQAVVPLHHFVNNPLFSLNERERILNALFADKIHPLTLKTIHFLNHKNRLYCLDELVIAFDEYYVNSHTQVRANIQTALPLTDEQKKNILDILIRKSSKNVIAHWDINRSLIGGFKVYIDGKLYDYSFSNQLESFKQHINEATLEFVK